MSATKLHDYKKLTQYNSLEPVDQEFFDILYPVLLFQKRIAISNQELLFNISDKVPFKSERQLRIHLKNLIDARLIEREVVKKKNPYGHWENYRYLYLNRFTFNEDASNARGYNNV